MSAPTPSPTPAPTGWPVGVRLIMAVAFAAVGFVAIWQGFGAAGNVFTGRAAHPCECMGRAPGR